MPPKPVVLDEALINALAYGTVDNETGSVAKLQQVADFFKASRWPLEYSKTTHTLHPGDARNLSWVSSNSVHLVVTSPPYWTLKEYAPHEQQMGAIADYEAFLVELDKVWAECARVLVPGGRVCCVVGDVCIPRKRRSPPRYAPARGHPLPPQGRFLPLPDPHAARSLRPHQGRDAAMAQDLLDRREG